MDARAEASPSAVRRLPPALHGARMKRLKEEFMTAQGRPRRPRWRLWSAAGVATVMVTAGGVVSALAATVDTSAWYVLVNRNSGKALEVLGQSTADGARVTQSARNDQVGQQWQFVDSGGGYYRLRSRVSSKVLDVYQRSTAD